MSSPDPHAGHRQVTGLLVPALLLVVLIAMLGLGWWLGSSVALAVSLHWLLVLALMIGARRSLTLASRGGAAPASRVWSLPVGRLVVATLVAGAGLALFRWGALEPASHGVGTASLGVLLLGVAFGAGILARYYQATPRAELPDAPGLASANRVGTWLALIGAASSFTCALGRPLFEIQTAWLLLAVPGLMALELAITGVAGLIRRPRAGAPFGADLLVSRVLGSSYNPIQSVFTAVEETFGVDVRSSWALVFLRRAALPVVAGLALLAWVLSAVVVVDAPQQAVRERFGRVDRERVLGPGLHLGLPWPFDRVQRVDVLRVRQLPLGYTDAKAGADALWTQYHAAEEFNLLLGDGRDLVTVNAELQYRIGDVHAWLYSCQNPERSLETLSYKVLMDATVDKTLDEVLSLDIGGFSARIHQAIQDQVDRQELGIEVVSFELRGLHPPVAVANDYQAVVAAQIDRTTFSMEAEAYRQGALPKAEAAAVRATRQAQADQAQRLSKARGEAIAFHTVEAEYKANPDLYRFRRRLETLEQVLKDNPHYIIDARIERDGGALWILE
jgi:HflK protein